jgi:hypothetical protein
MIGILMGETWRGISDWPYEVSDWGRVRRMENKRILKPWLMPIGYHQVCLQDRGRLLKEYVHRIVAVAFLGVPVGDRKEAAHYDGDKTNNNLTNLRWATRLENESDRVRHGRTTKGRKFPGRWKAPIEDHVAAAICSSPHGPTQTGRIFGVNRRTVQQIRKRAMNRATL